MNYRKRFAVEPGSKVRLDEIDPSFTAKHASEDDARETMEKDRKRLGEMQYRLYAENRRALLVVLQAPDAGGKDGTVRHVFGALNPQGATAHSFKVPTAEEAAHDFLWRAHKVTPARGTIAIFNRSYYEDVLVTRVHGLVDKDDVRKRFERIGEFEKNLAQAGTRILKFYLHISADEQLRRFQQRLEDPHRQWKISEADYAERPYWDDYRKAYEDALEHTSTDRAPWYVIPANHKWFRNLAVARIVVDMLDEMDPQYPPPSVDVDAMRAKFHAAEEQTAGSA
jgi:PPK2 family polyphosphate:nucleotide phosphotransferase